MALQTKSRRKRTAKARNANQKYFGEYVIYGGEIMTRGEMIQDLDRASGGNPRYRDAYLFGHETGSKNTRRNEVVFLGKRMTQGELLDMLNEEIEHEGKMVLKGDLLSP